MCSKHNVIIDCPHRFAISIETQFQSQVSSKLLIYFSRNVTFPLEDMGRVSQHVRGRIVGLLDAGKGVRKTATSLGWIRQQFADGEIDSALLAKVKDSLCAGRFFL